MKEQKLKTFKTHLQELMENPEFAMGFEEEKKLLEFQLKLQCKDKN